MKHVVMAVLMSMIAGCAIDTPQVSTAPEDPTSESSSELEQPLTIKPGLCDQLAGVCVPQSQCTPLGGSLGDRCSSPAQTWCCFYL